MHTARQFAVYLLLLILSASGENSLAQSAAEFNAERLAKARRSGEITVREGEHLFALGRALLGDDIAVVNRFRNEVIALNPALGAGGGRIQPGMRITLPAYLKIAQSTPAPATTPPVTTAPAPAATSLALRSAQALGALGSATESASLSSTPPSPVRDTPLQPATMLALKPAPGSTAAESAPPTNPATTAPARVSESGASRLLPLEVTINGAKAGTVVFLESADALYATRDVFEEWRLQLPPNPPALNYRGQEYVALSSLSDHKSRIDFSNQSIELMFAPGAFSATRITRETVKKPVVSPVLPSMFFNYDFNQSTLEQRAGPTIRSLGLLGEAGLSSGLGVLTTSLAGRNLTRNTSSGEKSEWLRLESTFTKDFPEHNHTLRLGDTRTQGGMLGRDVYFGGVQYGTNFGLTPGFVTQPLPTLSGLSAAQSTVELYVNDVLRQVSTVPSGPFTIDRLPGLTGGGEARMVVRDLLGRETVIVQPFFTNGQLLATGLSDWRVEAGAMRRDFGTRNSNYGPGFANGNLRYGVSDGFTLEGTAAATDHLRYLAAGATVALPFNILGRSGAAHSEERRSGSGSLWLLGAEHQGSSVSTSVQAQGATLNFRQIGQQRDVTPTRLQVAGNISYTSASLGTFGLGYASILRYASDPVATMSANYSVRVGEKSTLSVIASQVLTGIRSMTLGFNLIVPLGNNVIANASVGRRNGREDFFISASKNPGIDGDNLGWRMLAGRQQELDRYEGGLNYTGAHGRVTADYSQTPLQSAMRLGAIGGLVLTDGHLFATPRVDQSFAIVEVAGLGNVGVGLGSNMLTKTNAGGIALVPRLAPYQSNSVRLSAQDLPFSAEIESIEINAVPAWRSGVKVVFPVRSGRGALLKINFSDGEPAPAGAIVRIEGDTQEFYVGRRGEAYVTGLQSGSRVALAWKDQRCVFDVVLPPEVADDIARLGPFLCSGVTR